MRTFRISIALAAVAVAVTTALPAAANAQPPTATMAAVAAAQPAAVTAQTVAAAALGPQDQCSAAYFWDNSLLGPRRLPIAGAVGDELAGYQRTGDMSAARFLATYYDPTANGGSGGWIYPPDNGYVTGPNGKPEEFKLKLFKGQDIDRFGSEFGGFLGPQGLPYSARSIPPASLDSTPAALCNYHDYQVLKPFRVDAGPIAPWFGQPGGGTQFQLDGSMVSGAPAQLNVMWLVDNGYLERLPA